MTAVRQLDRPAVDLTTDNLVDLIDVSSRSLTMYLLNEALARERMRDRMQRAQERQLANVLRSERRHRRASLPRGRRTAR